MLKTKLATPTSRLVLGMLLGVQHAFEVVQDFVARGRFLAGRWVAGVLGGYVLARGHARVILPDAGQSRLAVQAIAPGLAEHLVLQVLLLVCLQGQHVAVEHYPSFPDGLADEIRAEVLLRVRPCFDDLYSQQDLAFPPAFWSLIDTMQLHGTRLLFGARDALDELADRAGRVVRPLPDD